jgi:hypothetical protein
VDSVLLGLFTFAAGLLIGHRLSLGRDKRKEFNEAVQPIRAYFLAESENPSAYRKQPLTSELDLLFYKIHVWDRRKLRKAIAAFHVEKQAAEVRNKLGEVLYGETKTIKEAANHVLRCTRFR